MAKRDYYEMLLTLRERFAIMDIAAPRVGFGLSGAFLCNRNGGYSEDLY